jgi:signal transduction histidine kinase
LPAKLSPDASAERLGDFLRRLGASRPDVRPVVALAHRQARAHAFGHQSPPAVELVGRVADLLAQLALDHSWKRSDVGKIVEEIAAMTGMPVDVVRLELHGRVARDPRVIALSPSVAIEMALRVFFALTDVESVALWTASQTDGVSCAFSTGPAKTGRRERLLARTVLGGSERERSRSTYAAAVSRWQRPEAALVFVADEGSAEVARAAAKTTAAAMTLVLEREALLRRSAARERALVEGGERLLARLGFDLHDGPIQDVAALAGDLRMLRAQIDQGIGAPVNGQIDDLQARIAAVDRGLRDIVHSLESPSVARRPLGDVLRREIDSFGAQTELQIDLVQRGDFSELTDSQRIALMRIIQESLTNIREHSGATKVSVSVTRTRNQIAAEVTDNGRGFDVERTLMRSARNGRVGLLGMSERARLLGGRLDVRSRRGGPTTVSLVLPAWRPATVEHGPVRAVEALSLG